MKAYQLLLNCEAAPQGYIIIYSRIKELQVAGVEQSASRMWLHVSVGMDHVCTRSKVQMTLTCLCRLDYCCCLLVPFLQSVKCCIALFEIFIVILNMAVFFQTTVIFRMCSSIIHPEIKFLTISKFSFTLKILFQLD